MPAPAQVTGDEIVAIQNRLSAIIAEGHRLPFTQLSSEEHATLTALFYHGGESARLTMSVVAQQLQTEAREYSDRQESRLARWNAREFNALNFTLYANAGTSQREADDALRQRMLEESNNVLEIGANGARRRRRNTTINVETADDMVETQSMLLVALGLLEQRRAGRVWYDSFHKRVYSDWDGSEDGEVVPVFTIDDTFTRRVMRWLHSIDSRFARVTENQTHSFVMSFAEHDTRNAPRDWLALQTWDGIARLDKLFVTGFNAPDSAFNAEAGRCWFISMVARIMTPGCKVDTMPVLIGGQGLFKSQALEVIGGEWYRAASSGIDSKDFLQELHGAMVFEIPELHSIISSRHGAAIVKAKLSIREDHFRLSYGRIAQTFKRTAVWVGTTNNRDWHTDDTGGRRFWPVHVGVIDLNWLRNNRAQLFAEARIYWQARLNALADGMTDDDDSDAIQMGKWWNVPEDEQVALMADETVRHGWQGMLEARLHREIADNNVYRGLPTRDVAVTAWNGLVGEGADWGTLLTSERIALQFLGLQSSELGRGSVATKTIGSIMRGLGWELKRMRVAGRSDRPHAWTLSHLTISDMERTRLSGLDGTDGTNVTTPSADDDSPF